MAFAGYARVARMMLAAGVPLTDVSKRLAHVNPHVTATVYAHALPGRDDLSAAAWESSQKNGRPAGKKQGRKTLNPLFLMHSHQVVRCAILHMVYAS